MDANPHRPSPSDLSECPDFKRAEDSAYRALVLRKWGDYKNEVTFLGLTTQAIIRLAREHGVDPAEVSDEVYGRALGLYRSHVDDEPDDLLLPGRYGPASRASEIRGAVYLDTETTGLDRSGDEVLSLSVVDSHGMVLFDETFRPTRQESWPEAEAVNHISPADVADRPAISERVPQIQRIIDESGEVGGWRVGFDLDFLRAAGVVIGDKVPVRDASERFQRMWRSKEHQHLTDAARILGLSWNGRPHGSLADTLMTARVGEWLRGWEHHSQGTFWTLDELLEARWDSRGHEEPSLVGLRDEFRQTPLPVSPWMLDEIDDHLNLVGYLPAPERRLTVWEWLELDPGKASSARDPWGERLDERDESDFLDSLPSRPKSPVIPNGRDDGCERIR